ncbi:hypothetical protein PHET_03437 [Paragonimus heterotremus]|uniref:Uncharacterized protein n=1 Tax=Paragonimus heterotremus TaxID=100268 RepID=A0A8J4SNQ6_9TREM|nr:hypothetical protein PHET_03437 [Paragonimus heterotremus]
MRKYHTILLSLVWVVGWLNVLNTEYVTETDVFVTTPSTLFVEHANTILVRTKRPSSVVKLTTSIQYGSSVLFEDAVDHEMYKLPDSWYGTEIQYRPSFVPVAEEQMRVILNFSVALCTDYPACTNADNTKHLSQTVTVARRNAIVLGETDKPIYRPGEIVRMRFLALKPQFIVPLNEPVTYPPRKPIITLDGNLSFVELTSADVDMLNGVEYEEISLVDSRDSRVKQWLRASPRLAANLSYQLLDDAPEGEWQAKVHFSDFWS